MVDRKQPSIARVRAVHPLLKPFSTLFEVTEANCSIIVLYASRLLPRYSSLLWRPSWIYCLGGLKPFLGLGAFLKILFHSQKIKHTPETEQKLEPKNLVVRSL